MSDHHPSRAAPVPPPEDDAIARLLQLAGPRAPVPAERAARVRRRTQAAWRETLRFRRRRRLAVAAAALAAAVAALVLGLGLLTPPSTAPPPPVVVATVEAVAGVLQLPGDGTVADRPLAIGDPLLAGARLTTAADGRAALRLAAGPALRLDVGSRLLLAGAAAVELERGALYVDTGAGVLPAAGSAIAVTTRYGVARDIGTRFEVRVDAAALRLRVREGQVELERDDQRHQAAAGVELVVDAAGAVRRAAVPGHGAPWAWTVAAGPPFALEGRTLDAFLAWLARESGYRVQFADPALASRAGGHQLYGGSIANMSPDDALATVMTITGLRYRVDGDTVTIEAAAR